MGAYIFITTQDRITMRKVSDEYVNEEFQEALKHDPSLMIEEHKPVFKRRLFSYWSKNREPETTYSIYHETHAFDKTPYQARLQGSGSGDKRVVIAYLHGIINGSVHREMNAVSNRR